MSSVIRQAKSKKQYEKVELSDRVTIYEGDCRQTLAQIPDSSVHCCVTSPPYFGLRSYLPDVVQPKKDTPQWVFDELAKNNISPLTILRNEV